MKTIERNIVRFGSQVRVRDDEGEDEFVIHDTADIELGRISLDSPLGRALMGRMAGETVEVAAPGGVRSVFIADVR